MSAIYVQYGCAFTAPAGWVNFDSSPTLRFERLPVAGSLYTKNKTRFPANAKYGDILKGLPGIAPNSCQGIFCSHVLEHLSLEDCDLAIANTFDLLRPGGIFRIVIPDLEAMARTYIQERDQGLPDASIRFVKSTGMGMRKRPRNLAGLIKAWLGNAAHLWMWDQASMTDKLRQGGFTDIRNAQFNDSADPKFIEVEDATRFADGFALEARKPFQN